MCLLDGVEGSTAIRRDTLSLPDGVEGHTHTRGGTPRLLTANSKIFTRRRRKFLCCSLYTCAPRDAAAAT